MGGRGAVGGDLPSESPKGHTPLPPVHGDASQGSWGLCLSGPAVQLRCVISWSLPLSLSLPPRLSLSLSLTLFRSLRDPARHSCSSCRLHTMIIDSARSGEVKWNGVGGEVISQLTTPPPPREKRKKSYRGRRCSLFSVRKRNWFEVKYDPAPPPILAHTEWDWSMVLIDDSYACKYLLM